MRWHKTGISTPTGARREADVETIETNDTHYTGHCAIEWMFTKCAARASDRPTLSPNTTHQRSDFSNNWYAVSCVVIYSNAWCRCSNDLYLVIRDYSQHLFEDVFYRS